VGCNSSDLWASQRRVILNFSSILIQRRVNLFRDQEKKLIQTNFVINLQVLQICLVVTALWKMNKQGELFLKKKLIIDIVSLTSFLPVEYVSWVVCSTTPHDLFVAKTSTHSVLKRGNSSLLRSQIILNLIKF
jgi:hypothetical protein